MSLSIGSRLHGFTVKNIRPVEELSGSLVEMTHDKTGAGLVWMDNGETNKLFSVAFKTIPENDTGVFHILEHSVLCGSEKYPVREPFVELLKSSMQTFLNAMTFPDKTLYPVSSRNEQDFLNLTDVYLDAVFAPVVGKNPNVFYQEGWHIELDEAGKASYKGVVFNEMKGAMSDVDDVIDSSIQQMLFPDSCYGFNSGGDPKAIPSLTYEQYLETYHRFYHPSNAYFFLDGAVPLEKVLARIDAYLQKYERLEELPEIAFQKPVGSERTVFYEIGPDQPEENQSHLILGKIAGTWQDKTMLTAADVLCDVLAGTNESPLKKAILSAGLGQDVTLGILDGVAQPVVMLGVRNTEDSNAGEIRALIRKTLKEIAEKGLDKGDLIASINSMEFRTKQMREPQGLMRCINSMSSWLYGGDPLMYLIWNDTFKELRSMVDNGGFDRLLQTLLLDEENQCILHLLPSKTLGAEMRADEAARLEKIQSAWSAAEKEAIADMNKKLTAWQATPDSMEQLSTLPVLSLDEVSEEPEMTETLVGDCGGVKLLYHPVPSNGILHLGLFFSMTDYTAEELGSLAMLGSLYGNLPTASHPDAADLQREIKTWLGSLNFGIQAYSDKDDQETCTPYFTVKCSVLEGNLEKAKELLHEILTETDFTAKDSIRNLVLQNFEMAKQYAVTGGHSLAISCVNAHYSARGAVSEATSGYSAYCILKDLAGSFEERIGSFTALMERFAAQSICRARLILSLTATNSVDLAGFAASFPEGLAVPEKAGYSAIQPKRMAIRIPAQIGYAVQGYQLAEEKQPWNGSLAVAAQLLSLDYLWNRVRVQGGSYGTGLRAGRDGSVTCYSFRDPSPVQTLGVYGGFAEALRRFCDSEEPLDKYIISTISETEPLVSPAQKGAIADTRILSGITKEDVKASRREMLTTTREALLSWGGFLTKLSENGAVCVVGHDGVMDGCREQGMTVVEL